VKGFWKSVKNWQSYRHEFGVLAIWDTVFILLGCRLPSSFFVLQNLCINSLEFTANYSATTNNIKLVGLHWPLMRWLSHLVQRGGDWAGPQPAQVLAVPNVTAYPSTASISIAVLLCGFNVSYRVNVNTVLLF